jgi:hypothetical protein
MLECCYSEDGDSGFSMNAYSRLRICEHTADRLCRLVEAFPGAYQKCRDLSRSGTLLWTLHIDLLLILVTGSSMIVEVTDLLRRATLKIDAIDLSELVDPDSQDYMARYHFLCAWMVRTVDFELLKATNVHRR